jgi:ketosteroid isomerase-like protein
MTAESTTPDLVENVRVMLDAADRADFDAVLAFYAADAVWVMASMDVAFEGVEAIRGLWEDWYGLYEDFRVGRPDIRDLGNGVVMAISRVGGRLRGSGELSQDLAMIYEWSHGQVVRVTGIRAENGRAAAERLAKERG